MEGENMSVSYRVPPPGMEARILAADETLKACPYTLCDHHGGEVIDWEQHVVPHSGREVHVYFVFCNSCNTRGPRLDTPERAAEVWNERDPAKQVDIGP
jgi:hypothetical protein